MAKVLIGEDESDIALALRILFSRDGHDVAVTPDGPQTARAAIEDPPDLLVLNLLMPGMTGLDVCRTLRAEPATAQLPILMVSALLTSGEALSVQAAGVTACMMKPFANTELLATAYRLLDAQDARAATSAAGVE